MTTQLDDFYHQLSMEADSIRQNARKKQQKLKFDQLLEKEKELFKMFEAAKCGLKEDCENFIDIEFNKHWQTQIQNYNQLCQLIETEAQEHKFEFKLSRRDPIQIYKELEKNHKGFHTTKPIYLEFYGGLYWKIMNENQQPVVKHHVQNMILIPENVKIQIQNSTAYVKLNYDLSQILQTKTELVQTGELSMKDYEDWFFTESIMKKKI